MFVVVASLLDVVVVVVVVVVLLPSELPCTAIGSIPRHVVTL